MGEEAGSAGRSRRSPHTRRRGRRRWRGSRSRCRDAPVGAPPEGNAKEVTRRRRRVTTAASTRRRRRETTVSWRTAACQPPGVIQDIRSDGGRTVAMVTARARVPAMACVGEPAAGRGARRRRDLWRSSASRVALTSKPLRPVEKFGLPRSKEHRAPLLLPNLGRRSGATMGGMGATHRHTDKSEIGPGSKTRLWEIRVHSLF